VRQLAEFVGVVAVAAAAAIVYMRSAVPGPAARLAQSGKLVVVLSVHAAAAAAAGHDVVLVASAAACSAVADSSPARRPEGQACHFVAAGREMLLADAGPMLGLFGSESAVSAPRL